ncbi:DUF3631 domain-containing protein [Paraburkholderia xenovorans]|uniref:DUF3631 domain-containing protein n=1 Tax=Paraburkholderia xenovorans TaxID=36873 RepID=UPI001558D05E|nr:DUF3631 domain-containing protein [Paraburkholderia xenovorans]NPT36261.1 DUF3631 domain-containing protein [Paraburkholderia xenovorans]
MYSKIINPEPGEESGAPPDRPCNSRPPVVPTSILPITESSSQIAVDTSSSPIPPDPTEGATNSDNAVAAARKQHVLDRLANYYGKCIICPQWMIHTMVLWTAMTYCIDIQRVSPILYITSRRRASGKSRALLTIAQFVRKPLVCSYITGPGVYRWIEEFHPTLVLDEADEIISRNLELKSILGGAYNRGAARAAMAQRMEYGGIGGDLASIRADMLFAGRSKLPPRLRERSIVLYLPFEESGPDLRRVEFDFPALNPFRKEVEEWCESAVKAVKAVMRKLSRPPGLTYQMADMFEVVFAIAHHAGEHWPERAMEAARMLSVTEGGSDKVLAGMMLEHIETILCEADVAKNGWSCAELLAELCSNAEWPWVTYNGGSPIDLPEMRRILLERNLQSENHGGGKRGRRGYFRKKLEEAIKNHTVRNDDEAVRRPRSRSH